MGQIKPQTGDMIGTDKTSDKRYDWDRENLR